MHAHRNWAAGGGHNYAISWLLHKWFSQVFQLEILLRFWVNSSVVIRTKVKHSWIRFLISSIPTWIFTSIIMKCHRFDYSTVVFFRAHHHQIKSWIPAATERIPERVLLFNYVFHQPDRLNTVIEMLKFVCSAAAWAIKLPVATIVTCSSPSVCHWLMMSSMCYKNQCCTSYKHEVLKLSVQCAMTLAIWVLSWAIHCGVASQQHSPEIVVRYFCAYSLSLSSTVHSIPILLSYCSFISHFTALLHATHSQNTYVEGPICKLTCNVAYAPAAIA